MCYRLKCCYQHMQMEVYVGSLVTQIFYLMATFTFIIDLNVHQWPIIYKNVPLRLWSIFIFRRSQSINVDLMRICASFRSMIDYEPLIVVRCFVMKRCLIMVMWMPAIGIYYVENRLSPIVFRRWWHMAWQFSNDAIACVFFHIGDRPMLWDDIYVAFNDGVFMIAGMGSISMTQFYPRHSHALSKIIIITYSFSLLNLNLKIFGNGYTISNQTS